MRTLRWLEDVQRSVSAINLPGRSGFGGSGNLADITDVEMIVEATKLPTRQEFGVVPSREIKTGKEPVTETELDTILAGLNRKNVFGRFQAPMVTVDYAVEYGVSWALYYGAGREVLNKIGKLDPDKARYDEPKYLNEADLKKVVEAALRAARYAMTKVFTADLKDIKELRDSDIRNAGVEIPGFDDVWATWIIKVKRESQHSQGLIL